MAVGGMALRPRDAELDVHVDLGFVNVVQPPALGGRVLHDGLCPPVRHHGTWRTTTPGGGGGRGGGLLVVAVVVVEAEKEEKEDQWWWDGGVGW